MHIIVIGGGNVGSHIAKNLLEKKQKVILIDKDEETVNSIRKTMDINLIMGNGASIDVLKKAKIDSANMLIALMENDDANILASMLAKTFSKEITTIARVRDPESVGSIDIDAYGLTQKQVGLDVIISPELAVAEEMAKIIHFPDVDEVDYFAKEKLKLIGKVIQKNSDITGKKIRDVKLPENTKIVGLVKENGNFFFPHDTETLLEGDKIYLLGTIQAIRSASRLLYREESKTKRVIILGGGSIGYALAEDLESSNDRSFVTKIIEADPRRCEELNRRLKNTQIIQGDGTDNTYYNEEEIREADVLVTATKDDRINLIASVIGKEAGVKDIINALEDSEYSEVYPKMRLKRVINPQLITAEKILRYVHREEVVSLAVLEEDVEVLEVVVVKGCRIAGTTIGKTKFPEGILIGAIIRKGSVITPDIDTVLEDRDHLVIVALSKISLNLDEYFICESPEGSSH